MLGCSQKQLRVYETKGIVQPARSEGNRRLYSQKDVELLTFVHYLASVRKVNIAGIKVVLEMLDKLTNEKKEQYLLSIEEEIASLSDLDKKAFELEGPADLPLKENGQDREEF